MLSRTRERKPCVLEVPAVFEDLTGILSAEIDVIAGALVDRAGERLLLSRRQLQDLRLSLRNDLAEVVNRALAPLEIERH